MPLIITCEHGGNRIPKKYSSLFKNKKRILESHRGWDPGALVLARQLARELSAPLFYSDVSRLLIDLNRSVHHPDLFSDYSRECSNDTKQKLIAEFYQPYRDQVEQTIKKLQGAGQPLLHLSIHSFTPVMNDKPRNADIGLLYDPSRNLERSYCQQFKSSINKALPELRLRNNYPYRGTADGFTTYLRKRYTASRYLGIEIEINQKHVNDNNQTWLLIRKKLAKLILQTSNTIIN